MFKQQARQRAKQAPAGAKASLVLDFGHRAVVPPVPGGRCVSVMVLQQASDAGHLWRRCVWWQQNLRSELLLRHVTVRGVGSREGYSKEPVQRTHESSVKMILHTRFVCTLLLLPLLMSIFATVRDLQKILIYGQSFRLHFCVKSCQAIK